MNTRIFTQKTLCPTKVKNHDLPPVGFSTLHYHRQIGYKVTHPVTSNSHATSHTFGHTHHILISPRLRQNTDSQKNEIFLLTTMLLAQANVRRMKVLIFFKDLNNLNHTHKVLGFLSLKAHKFLKTENLLFCQFASSQNNVFSFLK